MKRIILSAILVLCFIGVGWGQTKAVNTRLKNLEMSVKELQEETDQLRRYLEMVSGTMPKDTDIYQDSNDPTEPGDIKIVRGTSVVLDTGDDVATWSVESGVGVTIELDESNVYEGTGSIKVMVPSGITAIIKCTIGASDISDQKYLNIYLRKGYAIEWGNLYFGEAAYNEQSHAITSTGVYIWKREIWDISALAVASRNAVTEFAVSAVSSDTVQNYFWIDYVYADPGPSSIRAYDGDRVINIYPKIYHGKYTSTGAALMIEIPRKGTPSYIEIQRDHATDSPCIYWQKEFGAGNVLSKTAAGIFLTNRIDIVGDCYFTLGTDVEVNAAAAHDYYYTVMWED